MIDAFWAFSVVFNVEKKQKSTKLSLGLLLCLSLQLGEAELRVGDLFTGVRVWMSWDWVVTYALASAMAALAVSVCLEACSSYLNPSSYACACTDVCVSSKYKRACMSMQRHKV